MTLTIQHTGAGAPKPAPGQISNKPPAVDTNTYKTKLTFEDGRVIWRSSPTPDRVSLVGYFSAHQFQASTAGSLDECVMALSEGLKGAVECNGGSGWVSHSGGTVGKFVLLCGDRSASVHVHIGREKTTNGAGFNYPMRLEFNPRKLKLAGAKDLLGTFAMASDKPFDFGSFLAATRVTRLDVAVDFVGLRPSELLVTSKTAGKRVDYHGQDGSLESFQLHGKKKAVTKPKKKLLRPLGPLLIKVYDRNAERAARGKPPPVPGHHVTRAEVVHLRFPKGFGLVDVIEYQAFEKVAVSYAPACAPWNDLKRWEAYRALRAARGASQAAEIAGLSTVEQKAAEKVFAARPNNLLKDLDQSASHAGFEATGLPLLLATLPV